MTINEVLKEFEETFSGVDNDGTYKQCIANDVKDWLKEKLTAFEKSVKEEFLKRILPEENLDEDNIQYANGWNVCRENIINKANNI